ncbi:DUF6429 family protein [Clostridium sp. SYSU_GA19001]|uniref:DUF6429 family protein n=1 Tax=Clostridium caldaquaticum TaxID=2940653 RepID=UPI0020770144|nr:DUF6429 family protein [Clostridium caldaquaticum]MCM8710130.1 DUF6429 family protein [Clostridium caldaquaticum]
MMDEKIKELTLLLLYLTSWEDDCEPFKCQRSWKGYNFDALNELKNEGYIGGGYKSKSVYFTDEGIKKAEELMCRYLKNCKSHEK